jgi:hypothetical protein
VDGRIAVTTRALQRTVTAIAAERLGVPAKDVSVTLTDDRGLLSIAVTGPLRVAPLRDPQRGAGVLTRIENARVGIRDDVTEILGSRVGLVSVSVSRAVILEEKRVQ